jgi:hypothetical protein
MPLLKHVLVAIAIGTLSVDIYAGEILETRSIAITLPSGWTEQANTNPISATGPAGELLQLTVIGSSTQAGTSPSAASLAKAEDAAVAAMQAAASSQDLNILLPLTSVQLQSGVFMHEVVSRSKDGARVLLQMSLRGPNGVVLATMEGLASSGAQLAEVRKSLLAARWK